MTYKPVILIGNGCRYNPALVDYLCSLGIPVLTTWMATDLIPEDSPVFCGRPGVFGQRAANIIQQKADILMCFGARLDDSQIAYKYENFAPKAIKIIYDVDPVELDKFPKDKKWVIRHGDIPDFSIKVEFPNGMIDHDWLNWCKALYHRFRPELEGLEDCGFVDPFHFISALSDYAQPDDVLAVGSSGFAPQTFMQAFKIKAGQRVTNCSTIGAMGADIPMAIGACIASGRRRTLCVTGDGGFMLNVQELEVVRRLNLPITFFIYSNNGYGSIRAMQDARFEGRHVACDPESGLTLPRLAEIAACFGLEHQRIQSLQNGYAFDGQIIELMIDPAWQQFPKVMSSVVNGQSQPDPMEDMTPKLPADELKAVMEWDND